jgi:hypothetical protein
MACLQITFSAEQLARLDAASHIDPGFPNSMFTSNAMPMMLGNVKVRGMS